MFQVWESSRIEAKSVHQYLRFAYIHGPVCLRATPRTLRSASCAQRAGSALCFSSLQRSLSGCGILSATLAPRQVEPGCIAVPSRRAAGALEPREGCDAENPRGEAAVLPRCILNAADSL
eukprot:s1126_g3.t1